MSKSTSSELPPLELEVECHPDGGPLMFLVTSQTTRAGFRATKSSVVRSLDDFEAFQAQLETAHPYSVVPACAAKDLLALLDRIGMRLSVPAGDAQQSAALEEERLQKRCRQLSRFLRRVASHPRLGTTLALSHFLGDRHWLPDNTSSSSDSHSNADHSNENESLVQRLRALEKGLSGAAAEADPERERFAQVAAYSEQYSAQLAALSQCFRRLSQLDQDQAAELSGAVSQLRLLADTDGALSAAYLRLAAPLLSAAEQRGQSARRCEAVLLEALDEYALLLRAVHRAVQNRALCVRRYAVAVSRVSALAEQLRQLEHQHLLPGHEQSSSGGSGLPSFSFAALRSMTARLVSAEDLPAQIARVSRELADAQLELDLTKGTLRRISTEFTTELEHFAKWKRADFREMLLAYAEVQKEHHRRALEEWTSFGADVAAAGPGLEFELPPGSSTTASKSSSSSSSATADVIRVSF